MPLLSYSAITNYPFQPFTKIYSSDTNAMFAAVQTLLNTTKLDYLNVQTHGLTRLGSSSNLAAGTANYAIYNDANGDLTEAAQLPTAQGGLGFNATPAGVADADKVPTVNALGTGYQLSVVPTPPPVKIFNFYRFS
jgi:hypothetical protein